MTQKDDSKNNNHSKITFVMGHLDFASPGREGGKKNPPAFWMPKSFGKIMNCRGEILIEFSLFLFITIGIKTRYFIITDT